MGMTKSLIIDDLNNYELSDDEINEQIYLKLNVIYQQYVDEYEIDVHIEQEKSNK